MADDKDRDTVTFTITLPVEEYERLLEMQELEGVETVNEVYKNALNRNYQFLMRVQEADRLITNMQALRNNKKAN